MSDDGMIEQASTAQLQNLEDRLEVFGEMLENSIEEGTNPVDISPELVRGYRDSALSWGFNRLARDFDRMAAYLDRRLAGDAYDSMACEGCGYSIPAGEYGLHLGVEEHWKAIAPWPDEDQFESGLLCLDCMDSRLQERVGVTLARSLEQDYFLVKHAPATDALVEVLPLDVIDRNIDELESPVEWQWLSEDQHERLIERVEAETANTEGTT